MKKILLLDTVRIVNTAVNGYGDAVALDSANVKAAFFQGMAIGRANNTDLLDTYDAHCYVDETDPFVVDNAFRLEGMYVLANLYGYPNEKSWYKVRDVKLGVTKIVDNVVNNCHLFLDKCEPPKEMDESDSGKSTESDSGLPESGWV